MYLYPLATREHYLHTCIGQQQKNRNEQKTWQKLQCTKDVLGGALQSLLTLVNKSNLPQIDSLNSSKAQADNDEKHPSKGSLCSRDTLCHYIQTTCCIVEGGREGGREKGRERTHGTYESM